MKKHLQKLMRIRLSPCWTGANDGPKFHSLLYHHIPHIQVSHHIYRILAHTFSLRKALKCGSTQQILVYCLPDWSRVLALSFSILLALHNALSPISLMLNRWVPMMFRAVLLIYSRSFDLGRYASLNFVWCFQLWTFLLFLFWSSKERGSYCLKFP